MGDGTHAYSYQNSAFMRAKNEAYEKAALEDWERVRCNCAYKGGSFTFMVGSFLKEKGKLNKQFLA